MAEIQGRSEGFFSFLGSMDGGKYDDLAIARMNLRHRFVVQKFSEEIKGQRVLDLASHDGRWPYAFAAAGARQVVGIEGRKELVDMFDDYPETPYKNKVSLTVGDIYDGVRKLIEQRERFDVVAVLGIYYHIMDHYGLLVLIDQLRPKIIIVDSEFMVDPWPHVAIVLEATSKDLNTTPYKENQVRAPVGIPSQQAMEKMAESLGYKTEWLDWESVSLDERRGVEDYYRQGKKRRFTCVLRK